MQTLQNYSSMEDPNDPHPIACLMLTLLLEYFEKTLKKSLQI